MCDVFLIKNEVFVSCILGQKKVVLFLEKGRMKKILLPTRPHSRMCINMFLISKKKTKKQEDKKAKETKEEKRISLENLTGYDHIVCEFALCTFNVLIES